MAHKPTREEAWTILTDHVKSPSLLSHALAVEAVMRHVARKKFADEELWGVIGLVHDVDYEEHPEEHLRHAPEILRSQGWPEEYIRAVASHGWGLCADLEPVSDLEKTLFAIDELTGLVAAAALVRPSRSVLDLPVKSVLKKWKVNITIMRAFARCANRWHPMGGWRKALVRNPVTDEIRRDDA
jgi:putative nucleotidyltransferase with HDIG domain